jgi:tetratricopeptide (TPR) repeat protein
LPDPARAASHLSAAGDVEAAAERYMIAAGQAAAVGAFGQAMEHVRRALLLVERLPSTPERRAFRIRTLLTLARLQWQAVDPTPEANVAFTLQSALLTVDGVLASLQDSDPADLIAEAHALAAGICYDLGDLESLARALEELTRASKLLLDAGDAVAAARLLNDQAAVFVRLGDPVRATHLLAQSQRVFESRADSDPVTMTELAETHHLLARLPFHAKIRSGHEADAVSMGMDHARTAERWYRKLGASRELARVWESMGRLELLRQRAEQASEHLSRALQVQSRIGDVTGLARTTGAMSEVLTLQGMHRNALMVLGDSITLNIDKGSPIGLAFNRRAYDALRRELADMPSPDIQRVLDELGSQLERAEGVLGRVPLPDAALT